MKNRIIDTVFELTGIENTTGARIKIEALINEIMAYVNRDEITEELFPVICTIIVDSFNSIDFNRVQSLNEGDMSISFLNNSPFFGKLEAFKVVRGIN